MKIRSFVFQVVIAALLIFRLSEFSIHDVHGQPAGQQSLDNFPQSGVLAANGNLPSGSLALPQLPMGMNGRAVPFLGSLSLGKDRQWNFAVTNQTDTALRVSGEVRQYDSERNQIASSNFQFKLAPGAQGSDKVAAQSKSVGCVLMLKSWNWSK